MFGSSNVQPLLSVEGNALRNCAEVATELTKDITKLGVAVCLLHHPQVDETISRITVREREEGRERGQKEGR